MIIFFGTQIYRKENVVKGWTQCEHCGTFAESVSYDARPWGHVYFIPLFPAGSKQRFLRQCKKCTIGMQIPLSKLDDVRDEIVEKVVDTLEELKRGNKEFFPDEDNCPVPCGTYLANTVSTLLCLGEDDEVEKMQDSLEALHANLELTLVRGAIHEFYGEEKEAEQCFRSVLKGNYDSIVYPLYLAQHYQRWGYLEDAEELYLDGHRRWPDDVSYLEPLLAIYEELKVYEDLCDTYEKIFELVPEMQREKPFVRAYSKACKKDGRDPLY